MRPSRYDGSAMEVVPCAHRLDVELFDDDDRPVADGEVGEIVLRPKSKFAMFNGYWNMPEET
jgi:crotonobetaine/carnitine-CoA ligase